MKLYYFFFLLFTLAISSTVKSNTMISVQQIDTPATSIYDQCLRDLLPDENSFSFCEKLNYLFDHWQFVLDSRGSQSGYYHRVGDEAEVNANPAMQKEPIYSEIIWIENNSDESPTGAFQAFVQDVSNCLPAEKFMKIETSDGEAIFRALGESKESFTQFKIFIQTDAIQQIVIEFL